MEEKQIARYGAWKSSISADVVMSGNCKNIHELQCAKDSVFWVEERFPYGINVLVEKKRYESMFVSWTSRKIAVRNTVHEYGGGLFTVTDKFVYYITKDGIFRQRSPISERELVMASDKSTRFADICFHEDRLYGICEVHSDNKVENLIVKIENKTMQTVVSGADFYAWPRVSPDGTQISWMEWNSPHMPWDETSIVIAKLEHGGAVGMEVLRLSLEKVNLQCPQYNFASELFVVADSTNWWNVYKVDLDEKKLGENIYPVDAEIGGPQWQFGEKHYAINKHGILLDVFGNLKFKRWGENDVQPIETPNYTWFRSIALSDDNMGYAIAAGPTKSTSVIQIDLNTKKIKVIREARPSSMINKHDISIPRSLNFSSDGNIVQGWYYPPFSSKHCAPEGSPPPPAVLIAHGGPTAYSPNTLDMRVQYMTSRGFAVFDVNYRGSTGFGTAYRNLLRRSWGIVDRNDMINAAKHLVSRKLADPKGLCLLGSSAGGFLILATVVESRLFAAAASLYGVSDLVGFVENTHKFEAGYNEQLIGKYPEEKKIYMERSPINMLDKLNTPTVFFHGHLDPVVPIAQSRQLYSALQAKGVKTSMTEFMDEAHGFKNAEVCKVTLNTFYEFFCEVLGIPLPTSCRR